MPSPEHHQWMRDVWCVFNSVARSAKDRTHKDRPILLPALTAQLPSVTLLPSFVTFRRLLAAAQPPGSVYQKPHFLSFFLQLSKTTLGSRWPTIRTRGHQRGG